MNNYERYLVKIVNQINRVIKQHTSVSDILQKSRAIIECSNIKLYKYFFLEKHNIISSHECKITLDIEKLSFTQIFFNSFDNLNDPLENIKLKRLENSQESKFKASPKFLFHDHTSSQIQQFPRQGSAIKNLNAKLSVSCFTTNPPKSKKSMLMWSHYANSHKGICYEYDIKDIINLDSVRANIIYLLPVKYISKTNYDELVKLHDKCFAENKDKSRNKNHNHLNENIVSDQYIKYFMLSILEKYTDSWKYENEWRLVHARNQSVLEGIKPINIYVGAKSTDYVGINKKCLSEIGKQAIQVNIDDFIND